MDFVHTFNKPKVYHEIVDYIIANYNDFIGCTVTSGVTFLQKYAAWKLNKSGSSFTPQDVLTAMRHMVDEGMLVRIGTWGRHPTYTVKRELRN